MLTPFDPYIEQTAEKKIKTAVPDLKIGNNPIDKKGNKLLHSVLFITLIAIIAVIIINENFKEKQKTINLKRRKEQKESDK